MSSERKESKEEAAECQKEEICIPQEVRIKYFPQVTNKFGYDLLPLFGFQEYRQKLMKEVSILENPTIAAKWKEFMDGLPMSAWAIKPIAMDSSKIAVFANYRRQKVPPDYYACFVGPSSPEAIFSKME